TPRSQTLPPIEDLPSEVGLLSRFGYSVGANAKSDSERQKLLAEIFHCPRAKIPRLTDAENLSAFVEAETHMRLKKMAKAIAFLYTTHKSQPNYQKALIHWKSDLIWLRHEYFDIRFDGKFPWPKT